jgi:hypothetical protein
MVQSEAAYGGWLSRSSAFPATDFDVSSRRHDSVIITARQQLTQDRSAKTSNLNEHLERLMAKRLNGDVVKGDLKGLNTELHGLKGLNTELHGLKGLNTELHDLKGLNTELHDLKGLNTELHGLNQDRSESKCLDALSDRSEGHNEEEEELSEESAAEHVC